MKTILLAAMGISLGMGIYCVIGSLVEEENFERKREMINYAIRCFVVALVILLTDMFLAE